MKIAKSSLIGLCSFILAVLVSYVGIVIYRTIEIKGPSGEGRPMGAQFFLLHAYLPQVLIIGVLFFGVAFYIEYRRIGRNG